MGGGGKGQFGGAEIESPHLPTGSKQIGQMRRRDRRQPQRTDRVAVALSEPLFAAADHRTLDAQLAPIACPH